MTLWNKGKGKCGWIKIDIEREKEKGKEEVNEVILKSKARKKNVECNEIMRRNARKEK